MEVLEMTEKEQAAIMIDIYRGSRKPRTGKKNYPISSVKQRPSLKRWES